MKQKQERQSRRKTPSKKKVIGESLIPDKKREEYLSLEKTPPEVIAKKLNKLERYYDRILDRNKNKKYPIWKPCSKCGEGVVMIPSKESLGKMCKECRKKVWLKNLN